MDPALTSIFDSLPLAALSLTDPHRNTTSCPSLTMRSTPSQSRVLRSFARPTPADAPSHDYLSPLDNLLDHWSSTQSTDLATCDSFSFPTWGLPPYATHGTNFAANLPCSAPRLPVLDFPPSPSDTCSSTSTDITSSPIPDTIRVVCDVPLLAPRPLPYHSPTFLQFDLPDTDEDLSHPPYTHRPSKRKREPDSDLGNDHHRTKRHAGIDSWRSRVQRSWHDPAPVHNSCWPCGNDRWQP
ncbi:hypothetical protein PAXRUDRAFT_8055 [Paxillus rubicundulus Ve08.2h10]|uniref:Uncharacterized protein n=1 Tax=Paxillus rubicundulus Ve08.2h10 TaxID=930991 RepID=A0A0D0DY72_9AGAM|nr:hypothetical protein PAXRUDRAFT_8055 [Paxillus rubicundulus Ve08.2h10]